MRKSFSAPRESNLPFFKNPVNSNFQSALGYDDFLCEYYKFNAIETDYQEPEYDQAELIPPPPPCQIENNDNSVSFTLTSEKKFDEILEMTVPIPDFVNDIMTDEQHLVFVTNFEKNAYLSLGLFW